MYYINGKVVLVSAPSSPNVTIIFLHCNAHTVLGNNYRLLLAVAHCDATNRAISVDVGSKLLSFLLHKDSR